MARAFCHALCRRNNSRARAESAAEIVVAVEAAHAAYRDWQCKIGRDVNPSELIARVVAAGAKRVAVTEPAFTEIARDECSRLGYDALVYGGIEDE